MLVKPRVFPRPGDPKPPAFFTLSHSLRPPTAAIRPLYRLRNPPSLQRSAPLIGSGHGPRVRSPKRATSEGEQLRARSLPPNGSQASLLQRRPPTSRPMLLLRFHIKEKASRCNCDLVGTSSADSERLDDGNEGPCSQLPFRCSMLSETHDSLAPQAEFVSFIKSSFNDIEGPNHRWVNIMDGNREFFNQDGIFLVLVNAYIEDSKFLDHREHGIAFERVKLLQQRYPKLNVFGLQCGISVYSIAAQTQIIQTVMEQYLAFPILISDKDFMKMINGAYYLFFDGRTNNLIHHKLNIDLGTITKVIEEFNILRKDNAVVLQDSNSNKTRQHEVIREPSICSSFRNLLLYYPGCISVDEDGKYLFISDSNHHRIIITDGNGMILDCIGSSPGFEDGEFESAKLLRPAGSFYDIADNCLYFVDSENHAIRRADMERRVLETLYPVSVQKTSGIWSWFLDKLGMAREVDMEAEGFDMNSIHFPWHLIKLGEDLLIINRSFETSWIISMATGDIKKVLRGTSDVWEVCEHMVMEKVALLKDMHENLLQYRLVYSFSLGKVSYAGLMSSLVKFQNNIIFCDSAAQRILKCDRESRSTSYIQFSELGVLGLPYWLICPLERVINRGHICSPWNELLHYSIVLPGRCAIRVNVDIPKGTELAAPLEEGCIWRQARGSAAELSGSEGMATSTEKVGVAQQWFDELDNLAFSKSEIESDLQDEERSIDRSFQDEDKVHFDCTLNISPGTSEVVVSAVLYLKLKKTQDIGEEQDSAARRVLDLQKLDVRKPEEDACVQLLLETYGDVRDVVFMKPLHLRIRLECGDHPAAVTSKETITTESKLQFDVSLN